MKAEIDANGGNGTRRKPPSTEKGDSREASAGIALPNIVPIYEVEWSTQDPPFDKYTALRLGITDVGENNGGAPNGSRHDVYDFKINMDNLFFKAELKHNSSDADLLRARWKYGLVLFGLALLHDDAQRRRSIEGHEDEEDNSQTIETKVEELTKALAPVLLPMINSLGSLDVEPGLVSSTAGEAT